MIEFQMVEGVSFAREASELLSAAWRAPALRYSAEYVGWQLSFPGPGDGNLLRRSAPAAAAFEGARCVGFAGSVHRRLRHGATLLDALVVTLVAVHPDARNRGVATGLYDLLLRAIGDQGAPVITFAAEESAGDRAIRSAYPRAGFELRSFGEYPMFACLPAKNATSSEWRVASAGETSPALRAAIENCAGDEDRIWSAPTDSQLEHYLRDPRGRHLLTRSAPDGSVSAAWAVSVEFVSSAGVQSVLTIDSLWTPRSAVAGLRELGSAVAALWPPSPSTVVQAPNLLGFDAASLRQAGFRQTGAGFRGYFAWPPGNARSVLARGTNLEVI